MAERRQLHGGARVPARGLGVEGDGAHAAHEHIVVADLPRRAALITALLTTPLTEAQT